MASNGKDKKTLPSKEVHNPHSVFMDETSSPHAYRCMVMVQRECSMSENGQMDIHDVGCIGWPSI
jgi:hypothetical protein